MLWLFRVYSIDPFRHLHFPKTIRAMTKPEESTIRDALSTRLELLEPGLKLIKIEQYLPNPQGTRGFVDLFAQDEAGKHVLIELKRSAAASREALHEVLKYLEALKNGLSVRDAEVRILIVSTEWSELLVPFSSFVKRTSCEVKGYLLEVDKDGIPTNAMPVTPIELAEDRLFAPWHELNLYESEQSLRKGIESYEKSCKEKEINNFVLVVMQPPPDHHQRSVEATQNYLNTLHNSMGNPNEEPMLVADKMPEYRYLVYFATLQLPEALCLSYAKSKLQGEDLEDFESYISDMNGDELLCTLHTKLYELEPDTERDHYEIGYPAKFGNRLLDEEGWTIDRIQRYGTLRANTNLTDEAIIDDLRGADGKNLQGYRKSFRPSIAAEVAEVQAGTKRCLRDNPLWRNQILRILDEFLPNDPAVEANITIFNPANFCLSLYRYLTQEDGADYIPYYILEFKKDSELVFFTFGTMRPTNGTPSFSSLIEKHYGGNNNELLYSLSWGGYLASDVLISHDLGMTYKSFKGEFKNRTKRLWELTEMGWESASSSIHPFLGFQEFAKKHRDFTSDILEFYSSHWDGFLWMSDADDAFQPRT